jgi:hypothetical protein
LPDGAAPGGIEMLKYAFDHGLDRSDFAASHFWARRTLLEVIKRKDLRSLKFLSEKGVRYALNYSDILLAVSGLVKPPVDRELASEILTVLFTSSTDSEPTIIRVFQESWAVEALVKCGANPLRLEPSHCNELGDAAAGAPSDTFRALLHSKHVLDMPTEELKQLVEKLRLEAKSHGYCSNVRVLDQFASKHGF